MATRIVGRPNLIGVRFTRLTVIRFSKQRLHKRPAWVCRCDCGKEIIVTENSLKRNNTRSCGCYKLDRTSETHRKHGMCRSRTYNTWCAMKDRCYNANNEDFHHYGGRGITICERWNNSFEAFFEDMGEKPLRMSIERINTNGNYEPGNCRWATQKEQTRNKRTNRLVTFRGETKTVSEWSEITGIDQRTLWDRLFNHKWPIEKAMNPQKRRRWDKH